ncbi:TIGR01459 family HAD-type hydrolase [Roseobacter litoralis]|uniref:Haloacid dehalogenase n=1 Tax=Roseobacter litoralis (strain ATCC 49566 / DSM 6996 / JCM 21268 / NBRC 15278 / OCh 149) TaxID=391595 RepID=F7Z9Q6_ROSLO|nr:TIGR01459 family HAD-type hydrolase [Roseobacter litoralis]AEI92865.1 putative haloacid dehalogenase [Roseobacter litoralis Och 149]
MKTDLMTLAPQYDAFLIDQFGVLLDGTGAYQGAAAALSTLTGMGKQVVLLSNSGKRAAPNSARLTRLGFDRDSYITVMSSGEAAFAEIKGRIGQDIAPGAAVWVHARDGDMSAVAGLDLTPVDEAAAADLLIIAGSRADEFDRAHYRRWLAPAAQRGVPAFCTNPDIKMLTPQGQRFGAGVIAQLYEELGGTVEWVGKPYPLIYRMGQAVLGPSERILCIGDSPEHDIAGGRAAGFATALVRTGLHAGLSEDALLEHCRATAMPDFIIPSFCWEGPRWH